MKTAPLYSNLHDRFCSFWAWCFCKVFRCYSTFYKINTLLLRPVAVRQLVDVRDKALDRLAHCCKAKMRTIAEVVLKPAPVFRNVQLKVLDAACQCGCLSLIVQLRRTVDAFTLHALECVAAAIAQSVHSKSTKRNVRPLVVSTLIELRWTTLNVVSPVESARRVCNAV